MIADRHNGIHLVVLCLCFSTDIESPSIIDAAVGCCLWVRIWAQIHRYCLEIYPKKCHKIILRKSYDVVRLSYDMINLKKTTGLSVNLSSVVLRHLKGDRNILS